MNYTYDSYSQLIDLIRENNYEITDYHSYAEHDRCVILRHDVDQSPKMALRIAETEAKKDVKSTFFVFLNTDMYNIASKTQYDIISEIRAMGHEIGLHFDEFMYPEGDISQYVLREADILSDILKMKIDVVSMHRPSQRTLEANYSIPGMINTYSELFFREFKYLSDSRRRWRDPPEENIRSGLHKRLQILTHPFWYKDTEENAEVTMERYINSANLERYESMSANVRNLSEIMTRGQVR